MLSPELLLLDEPAAGMNSQEARELETQIRLLRDELGVTVVLVEHNMSVVMSVCERIHVVDHGETIADGPPGAIKTDPKVLAAYLGQDRRRRGERRSRGRSRPTRRRSTSISSAVSYGGIRAVKGISLRRRARADRGA